MQKLKVHVVTHTHWDREWYLPFEVFRKRLVRLVDQLIDEMSKGDDFRHFMLDGQTVVLEDYLEIKPEMKDKLFDLIKSKRIGVGPWYILPDEFLITGEAFIRNYLVSQSLLKSFGLSGMNIGYLPDMFGHSAFTPTVLKNLGLKSTVVWRGIGDASRKSEFIWESPNGDGILAINLLHSYSNGAHFGRNIDEVKEQFKKEVKTLSKDCTTNNILIMNGTDHEMPIFDLPSHFDKWGKETNVEYIHSTLDNYTESVLNAKPKLKEVIGELRSPKYEPILRDVTSTRMYLKLQNFMAEMLYQHYVEPLSAILNTLGEKINRNEVEYGWKLILKSQPHDSICGCSIDDVHRDVEYRLRNATQQGLILCIDSLRSLSEKVKVEDKGVPLMVFNPPGHTTETIVEKVVYLEPGKDYRVFDEDGNELEGYVEETEDINNIVPVDYSLNTFKSPLMEILYSFNREKSATSVLSTIGAKKPYSITFKASLPPLGYKVFYIREAKKDVEKKEKSDTTFENAYFIFTLEEDGSFTLEGKKSGLKYEHLNYFEDTEDVGDEYNYSPAKHSKTLTTWGSNACVSQIKDLEFMKEITVDLNFKLPASIDSNREKRSEKLVNNPIEVTYRLYKFLPRIDMKVNLSNNARDHRLRSVFAIPEALDKTLCNSYFGLIEHPVSVNVEDSKDWSELNVSRYAMESFVTFNGDKAKGTIVTRGIPEYETTREDNSTRIKITLLRSIGWLSRNDISTRKSGAGPLIPTPEAQCVGEYSFEYSLILHNNWSVEEVYKRAREFLLPPIGIQVNNHREAGLPSTSNFLNELPEGVFISAFKISEDGSAHILRLFNPTRSDKEIVFNIKENEKVFLTDFTEEKVLEELTTNDSNVKIEIKKGEVLTIKIGD